MKQPRPLLRWTTAVAAGVAVAVLSGCVIVPPGYYRHGGGHGGYRYDGAGQGGAAYDPRGASAPPVVIVNPPPRGSRYRDDR